MITQEVTFTVKGFLPSFKEVIETEKGTHDEMVDKLNQVCLETFGNERAVVRDINLVVQK